MQPTKEQIQAALFDLNTISRQTAGNNTVLSAMLSEGDDWLKKNYNVIRDILTQALEQKPVEAIEGLDDALKEKVTIPTPSSMKSGYSITIDFRAGQLIYEAARAYQDLVEQKLVDEYSEEDKQDIHRMKCLTQKCFAVHDGDTIRRDVWQYLAKSAAQQKHSTMEHAVDRAIDYFIERYDLVEKTK